jgi:hypothetical protein
MAERIKIDAIRHLHPDTDAGLVHIEGSTSDGAVHLDLTSGALSTLVLSLRQAAQAFATESADFCSQSLELTSTGLIAREDGKLALRLVFDDDLLVVVDVPEDAIPILQECLFAMGEHRDDGVSPEVTRH